MKRRPSPFPTCRPSYARLNLSSWHCLVRPSLPGPASTSNQEDALRAKLLALHDQTAVVARQSILDLEQQHGQRRTWVWAKLGQAPLAMALKYLVALAKPRASRLAGRRSKLSLARMPAGVGRSTPLFSTHCLPSRRPMTSRPSRPPSCRFIALGWKAQRLHCKPLHYLILSKPMK